MYGQRAVWNAIDSTQQRPNDWLLSFIGALQKQGIDLLARQNEYWIVYDLTYADQQSSVFSIGTLSCYGYQKNERFHGMWFMLCWFLILAVSIFKRDIRSPSQECWKTSFNLRKAYSWTGKVGRILLPGSRSPEGDNRDSLKDQSFPSAYILLSSFLSNFPTLVLGMAGSWI